MKIGSHILVIDDNDAFRDLLREVLTDRGFKISEAANGEDALQMMDKEFYDMAIVDLEMPRLNGLEFTKRVKARSPRFPVVMVTAYASFYQPSEILAAGVDAFLQKPVPMDKLVKVVEEL